MNRRSLLQSTGIMTAAMGSRLFAATPNLRIIDTNVSLFHWPFRRLPLDDNKRLLQKMETLGIAKALAGSFEGILQRDLSAVNQRLANECQAHPGLVPIGTVNPTLPGWESDLKKCTELHGMPGIRLYPNYHDYRLDDPRFINLLHLAADMGLFVQITSTMEDIRTQPERLQVPDVDLAPLGENAVGTIQVLNWRPGGALLDQLAARPEISFDIARVDSTDGVATLLKTVPVDRVLFGTHAPFLVPEASLIRVHESNLEESQLVKVMQSNAATYLKG